MSEAISPEAILCFIGQNENLTEIPIEYRFYVHAGDAEKWVAKGVFNCTTAFVSRVCPATSAWKFPTVYDWCVFERGGGQAKRRKRIPVKAQVYYKDRPLSHYEKPKVPIFKLQIAGESAPEAVAALVRQSVEEFYAAAPAALRGEHDVIRCICEELQRHVEPRRRQPGEAGVHTALRTAS
jgi:hypothetical protein